MMSVLNQDTKIHNIIKPEEEVSNAEPGVSPSVSLAVGPEDDDTVDEDASEEDTSVGTPAVVIDSRCKGAVNCVAQSGDYRKVVSHVFGRNKKCTRDLPKDAWILWCRKHYQRFKYRAEDDGNWMIQQLKFVREQLNGFERLSNVVSWDVTLRKAEQSAIDAENASIAARITAGIKASTFTDPNGHIHLIVTNGAVNTVQKAISAPTGSDPMADGVGIESSTFVSINSKSDTTTNVIPNLTEITNDMPASATASISGASNDPTSDTATSATSSTTAEVLPDAPTKVASDAVTDPVASSPNPSNPPTAIGSDHDSDALSSITSPSPSDNDSSPETPTTPEPVWERFLIPHLGPSKTYTEVRAVLSLIESEFRTPAFKARDPKHKVFPGIEFLPNFPGAQARKSRVAPKTPVSTPATRAAWRERKAASNKRKREAKDAANGTEIDAEAADEGSNKRRRSLRSSVGSAS